MTVPRCASPDRPLIFADAFTRVVRVARVVEGETIAFEMHDDCTGKLPVKDLALFWHEYAPDALLLCAPATYTDKEEAEQSIWWAEAMATLATLWNDYVRAIYVSHR